MEYRENVGDVDTPLGAVVPNTIFGATPSVQQSGDINDPSLTGATDYNLPSVNVNGKIIKVLLKQNPIIILVQSDKDDSVLRLSLNLDQFRNIKGSKPKKGRRAMATLLRRNDDSSELPSQVQSLYVF